MEKINTEKWFDDILNSVDGKAAGVKNDVAKQIEDHLKKKNILKKDFAEKLGKSSAYVAKILRGDQNLTIQSLVEIADAIGLHIEIALNEIASSDWRRYSATLQNPEKNWVKGHKITEGYAQAWANKVGWAEAA